MLEMSIATLAATVMSFLVPLLTKGSEKLAEKAGEKVAEKVVDKSTEVGSSLWSKVKSIFVTEDDKAALTQFEKRPEAAKGLVQEILKEKLESNNALAKEFQELIKKVQPGGTSFGATVSNAENVGIADARHADFSHASNPEIIGQVFGELPSKRDKEE